MLVVAIVIPLILILVLIQLYTAGYILMPKSVSLAYKEAQSHRTKYESATLAVCHSGIEVIYTVTLGHGFGDTTEYFDRNGKSLGETEYSDAYVGSSPVPPLNISDYRCRSK